MKRLVPLITALLVVAPFAHADDITLGASVQMTGSSANTGRYYRDGYLFAVERVNAKGGVTVGGKKYTLALKMLDNQSDKDLSVRQYVQLISQDKVNFLLGPFASDFALADSAVSEKYEVPMIQGGGASDQIFSRGFKYVFGTLPAASKYFGSTVNMMKELNPKPQNVALLFADDSFDVSVAQGTRPLLKGGQFTVAIDERYPSNATDFGTLLARIKSSNIDAVLMAGHETEVLNFIRQAKSLDVNPKLYSFTVGVPSEDFRRSLGADGDYAFGMTVWLPSAAAKDADFSDAAKFAEAYKAKYHYDPDYHAASAVADVQAFVKALEAAGTLDPKAVRDAIAKLDFGTQYGRIKFDAAGQIDLPQTAIQIQKGKVVAVYSTRVLNKPQYPMPGWKQR